ncbi:NAD-dependent succinate-semialdehyde dehydrogenase [Bordetella genomosp. 10]|uniref:NAD-dependent succinate-semialdehyde dehydrogenase n=1 Tax=Bordetella genomosp. 10 TaxID=1416804 RepID=A0A261S5M6_9BORD|nr:NAD-dependent succinate-semialdehyde dehydrogenase [Bordetella genomosp. 10]OZI32080.1 NAD-dependent succinate-semialdehyde dehydrogenase [Bordetella genomosp. 10]
MLAYPEVRMRIGNEWRSGQSTLPVLNPVDNTLLGTVPKASREDIADAVRAAAAGLSVWRRMDPGARSRIMIEAARLIRQRQEAIASAMTLEQGKTLAQSRQEVARACDIIEWDAEEGRRVYGRMLPAADGLRQMVMKQPVGIVAAFSPWNFPASSPARKVAGPLAAGCSVILKASEETPASAMMLIQAFVDAGTPDGVVNLVFGEPAEISATLIADPAVRMMTFTGSVPVGKQLAALAGKYMKPVLLELGGHCPVIVCDDADPRSVALASVAAKARNTGQVCVSPTRFFVHRTGFETFVEAFAAEAGKLRLGNGLDEETDMGPLANARRLQAIDELVQDAVGKGARLAAGGARVDRPGNFYPLTVLADVPAHARCVQEEPFGPLAIIQPYEQIEDAIAAANGLPYALAAYAFTHDADRAALLADELDCGTLSINHFVASTADTPFGGVKDSGYGREGGIEGVNSYTITKMVSHKTAR